MNKRAIEIIKKTGPTESMDGRRRPIGKAAKSQI